MHYVEGLINIIKTEVVRDEFVDFDVSFHIIFYKFWNHIPAFGASESRACPLSPTDIF